MLNPTIFLVYHVGINEVMHVHILEWIFGPYPFHIPTLVLYQCKIFLPSLWLLFTYLPVLISVVRHYLSPNILPQNHQLPRWNWLDDCCLSIALGVLLGGDVHKVPGIGIGNHVMLVLVVGFHTHPWKYVPIVRFVLEVVFVHKLL